MLVQRNFGGQNVDSGDYWNLTKGERVHIESEGTLPGDGSVTYYRVPTLLVLLLAPVLGLIFAMFLPFIGIAMLGSVMGDALMSTQAVKSAGFNWSPATAYLSGGKRISKGNEATRTGARSGTKTAKQ